MRRIVGLCGVALLCATAALAGPKDQGKDSLIGPQAIAGNATVNNATTAFSFQTKGCKLQMKAKGLSGVLDGAILICVAGADVIANPVPAPPGSGNGIVLLGEVKSGGFSLKADLTEIGCGSTDQINFNGSLSCYLDDPAYRFTDTAAAMPPYPVGGWQADCNANGMVPIPNGKCSPPAATDECGRTKVNAEPSIVGLCQGFGGPGTRLDGPPAGLVATRGARGFVTPP